MTDTHYVPPYAATPVPQAQALESRPTFKGHTTGARIAVFLGFALLVAGGLGWIAWRLSADEVLAVSLALLALLVTFLPLYVWDSMVSTGYLHKRAELIVEQDRIHAAAQPQQAAMQAWAAQIESLWQAVDRLQAGLRALETVTVIDRKGSRVVARHDAIDMRIEAWLANEMFDGNGLLQGAHPSGHIKHAFPFKGDDDEAKQARGRLIAAGCLGQEGHNYVWTGPTTLQAALAKLQGVRTSQVS